MTLVENSPLAEQPSALAWPTALRRLIAGENTFGFSTQSRLIAGAVELSTDRLRTAVAEAYADLMLTVGRSAAPHAVRFWNYIPSIHGDMGSGLDRYMVFNAGRMDGFEQSLGSAETMQGHVATASAVGHDGSDLAIHCLSAGVPGRPVANPRQVDPVKYSARYGPRPPCFARATIVDTGGVAKLFVGGTASIRGEESLHGRHLVEQLAETNMNLAAVVTAAGFQNRADALSHFTELRVYHPAGVSQAQLQGPIGSSFVNVPNIEFVVADLCRAELLVEIEGIAEL